MATCGTYKTTYRPVEKVEVIESTDEESTAENIALENLTSAFLNSGPQEKKRRLYDLLDSSLKVVPQSSSSSSSSSTRMMMIHPSPSTLNSGNNSQTTTGTTSQTNQASKEVGNLTNEEDEEADEEESFAQQQQQQQQPPRKPPTGRYRTPVGGIESTTILKNINNGGKNAVNKKVNY